MKNSSLGTCDMDSLLEASRLDRGARRQRLGVEQDTALHDGQPIGRDALGERRRRLAVLRAILPAVPRTGDAAVHDLALAQRAALVGADIRHRRHLAAVTEDRDAL